MLGGACVQIIVTVNYEDCNLVCNCAQSRAFSQNLIKDVGFLVYLLFYNEFLIACWATSSNLILSDSLFFLSVVTYLSFLSSLRRLYPYCFTICDTQKYEPIRTYQRQFTHPKRLWEHKKTAKGFKENLKIWVCCQGKRRREWRTMVQKERRSSLTSIFHL